MTKDQLSSKQNPSALTPWWFHIPMVRVSTSDPHPLGRRIGAWISKWLKVWSHPSYMFPFKAVHRVTFSPHSNGSVWNCCETLHIAKSWTTLPVSFPAGEFQYNSAYVGAHLRMNMIYESAHEPRIKHLYRSHNCLLSAFFLPPLSRKYPRGSNRGTTGVVLAALLANDLGGLLTRSSLGWRVGSRMTMGGQGMNSQNSHYFQARMACGSAGQYWHGVVVGCFGWTCPFKTYLSRIYWV